MSEAPLRSCPGYGAPCRRPTRERRCPECAEKARAAARRTFARIDAERGPPAERYGPQWPAIARAYLGAHPLCEPCKRLGMTRAASSVDHVRPRSAGGGNEDANLQALCEECHRRKTARELRAARQGVGG